MNINPGNKKIMGGGVTRHYLFNQERKKFFRLFLSAERKDDLFIFHYQLFLGEILYEGICRKATIKK